MNPLAEQAESYTAGATAYLEFLEGRTAAAKLPRDGDKDGRVFDGTKREMPAPVVPRVPSILKADKAKDKPATEPLTFVRVPNEVPEVDTMWDKPDPWLDEVPVIPEDVLRWVASSVVMPEATEGDAGVVVSPGYTQWLAQDMVARLDRGETLEPEQYEQLWRQLTRTYNARIMLSNALQNGVRSPEELRLYQMVNETFQRAADRLGYGDMIPVERMGGSRSPFADNPAWKADRSQPDVGFVSFSRENALPVFADEDTPGAVKKVEVLDDGTERVTWELDVPSPLEDLSVLKDAPHPNWKPDTPHQDQGLRYVGKLPRQDILGRMGDMQEELIAAPPGRVEEFLRTGESVVGRPAPILKSDKAIEDGPFAGLGQVSPELQAHREKVAAEQALVAQRWAEMYPDDYVPSDGVDTSGFETLTPEQSELAEAQWAPLTGNVEYLSYEEEGFDWGELVRDLTPEQLTAIGRAALLGMSPEGRGELARVGGRTGELLLAGEWDPAIDRVLMPGGLSTTTEIYRYPPDWMLETVFEYEAKAREASAPGYVETGFGGKAGELSGDQLDKVRGLRRRLMAQDEVSPEDQQKIDVLSAVLKGESDLPDFAIFTFMADYFRDEAQKRVDATSAAFGDGTVADGYAHDIDEAFAIVGASVMAMAIGSWAGDSNRFGVIPLERGVADEFGVPYTQNPGLSAAVEADTNALYEASPEAWRTVARRIYDRTQAILEAQGITEALLYRGVGNTKTGPFDSPLTSWSVSPNVAAQFTGEKKYQTRVPAERIFAGPLTGLGKSEEAEVVLLPGDDAVAEVPAYGKGQPRMFDSWLDRDSDVEDPLARPQPVLKSNAMMEERLSAPTTEPLFRLKGGEWQASLDDVDSSDESKIEVLLPGSRPGDKPVPLLDYPFYRDDLNGAETAWVRGPSEPMTTAAADLTGQSDMPGSGWWSAEDEDRVTFDLTKELLGDVQSQEVSSLPVWSGQSGSVTFQEAEAGDVVAVPLIGVAPSRSTAEWYSRFRNTRGWYDEPTGKLAIQWEQGDEKKRADLAAAVADPTIVPLLLGGNQTLRTEPATGMDRNVVVQFDTSKVSPIDLGEGVTSGRYRVKSVQDIPDPDGLAYWDAEAGEFRHTPARLVTVEFVDDLSVQQREPVLTANRMNEAPAVDLSAVTRPGKPFRWKDRALGGGTMWVTADVSAGTVKKRLNALRDVLKQELPQLQGRDFTIDYWTDWDQYREAVLPGNNGYPMARWEPENNRVVISPGIAQNLFFADSTGSTDMRTVMHELVHAASPRTGPNTGPEPVLEEAMAEILSLDIANRRIADFGRATDREGDSGLRLLAKNVTYPDRVASVILNAASEVGWDRDAVMGKLREWWDSGEYAPNFRRFEYRNDGRDAATALAERRAEINKQYDDLVARLPQYADEYERSRTSMLDNLEANPPGVSWEAEARQRWDEQVAAARAAGVDVEAIRWDFTGEEYWYEQNTREEASVVQTTASSLVYWLLGGQTPILKSDAISETDDARELGWTIPIDAPTEYSGTDYQLEVPEAPTEQDLVDAVEEWVVNDPDTLREQLQAVTLQTGLGPWADDVARRNRRRTAALLNALETQGETTDYELLRGITIDDPYMGGLEGVMMDLPNVGRVIDLPISGFSGRRDVAERFAEVGYYNPDNDWVSVIYHLEPGAKALEMNRIYNPGYSEGEMMVGGRFEVTGKKIDEAEGVVHIFLKQTETIGAAPADGPSGEWR